MIKVGRRSARVIAFGGQSQEWPAKYFFRRNGHYGPSKSTFLTYKLRVSKSWLTKSVFLFISNLGEFWKMTIIMYHSSQQWSYSYSHSHWKFESHSNITRLFRVITLLSTLIVIAYGSSCGFVSFFFIWLTNTYKRIFSTMFDFSLTINFNE